MSKKLVFGLQRHDSTVVSFESISACDRQTDGRTDGQTGRTDTRRL